MHSVLKKYDADYSADRTLAMKAEYCRPLKVTEQLRLPFYYSEELFRYFGAETVDSIDNSAYENATIIRDLNVPVDNSLKNKYSCVWDGGTLEHIFNYPAALKNCMDMVEPGGYLVMQTPANNMFGHGFYQLQPDIFFSILCEQNGFTDTKVLMQDDWKRWYEIVPPKIIKDRVEICLSKKPCSLTVISKKTGNVPDVLNVQQEYFVDIWTNKNTKWSSSPLLEKMFKTFAPVRICQFVYFNIILKLLEGRRKKQFYKPVKLVSRGVR
ncbi:MAG: class I SAM-dependent methyltransferase [Spirochaetaceae bacterium]|nr:class I SAM-dependent methyltransferase [Spirochaetaceae bacterium]